MKSALPLQEEKKLFVTYRVEAGCLGPDGLSHIAKFCKFAQSEMEAVDSEYITWNIVHREDKTLPEMEYNVFGKVINDSQADKYLSMFGKNLNEFENNLSDLITNLIYQFMND
jgi:hypothetical protein